MVPLREAEPIDNAGRPAIAAFPEWIQSELPSS